MSRTSDYPVEEMFLARRSPRVFTGEGITEADLMTMLEASRWAPSASNVQPWRLVWARKGTAAWDRLFALVKPGNQKWARDASALVFVFSDGMRVTSSGDRTPSASHAFDAGIAAGFLSLQAHQMGWATHMMGGIEKEAALADLGAPQDHHAQVGIAIGRAAAPEDVPEDMKAREVPNGRKPLGEIAFEGRFPG